MRILVAGATGVIGRHLIPLLVEAGHDVSGTTRTPQGAQQLQQQGAGAHIVNVFDRAQVLRTVAEVAPQVVIHQLTALSGGSPVDNARIRREGTRNLVDAARAASVPAMIAQSISWAYEPGDAPADENVALDLGAPQPRATSVGGVVALEAAVAEIDRHVILRYATLYGPGTWFAPQGYMAQQLRESRLAANEGVSSFVHVTDAARAAVAALQWPSGTYNIADDEPSAATQWVPVLARHWASRSRGLDRPRPLGARSLQRGRTRPGLGTRLSELARRLLPPGRLTREGQTAVTAEYARSAHDCPCWLSATLICLRPVDGRRRLPAPTAARPAVEGHERALCHPSPNSTTWAAGTGLCWRSRGATSSTRPSSSPSSPTTI